MTQSRVPEALISEIRARAALPLELGRALPPEAYRSEALLEHELDAIFRREWISVGREDEVAERGDFVATEIAGEPVLLVRGDDGRVRALANSCRHRFAQVARGCGSAKRFTCPYHAWSYDLAGRLVDAPFMDEARDFSRADVRLPELRLESWNGFLYVNLDDAAEPLGPRLAGASSRLEKHGLDRMRVLVSGEELWDANWKLVAENAMESYHVFQGHRATLDPIFPAALLRLEPGAPGYNLHSSPMREGSSFPGTGDDALAANPGLPSEESRTLWLTCVYPAQIVVALPASFIALDVQPRGVKRSRVRWMVGVPGDPPSADTPKGAALRDAARAGTAAVNAEDRALVCAVQRGLASSRAESGRLSHLERPVWEFIGYLARRLGTKTGGDGGTRTPDTADMSRLL